MTGLTPNTPMGASHSNAPLMNNQGWTTEIRRYSFLYHSSMVHTILPFSTPSPMKEEKQGTYKKKQYFSPTFYTLRDKVHRETIGVHLAGSSRIPLPGSSRIPLVLHNRSVDHLWRVDGIELAGAFRHPFAPKHYRPCIHDHYTHRSSHPFVRHRSLPALSSHVSSLQTPLLRYPFLHPSRRHSRSETPAGLEEGRGWQPCSCSLEERNSLPATRATCSWDSRISATRRRDMQQMVDDFAITSHFLSPWFIRARLNCAPRGWWPQKCVT